MGGGHERPLAINVRWAVAGNVVYAACQWAILIVFARLAGAAELGEFTFGVAVTGPIVMLANMQLRSVQASDAGGEFGHQQYLGLRLSSGTAALALIGGVALALPASGYTALVLVAVGIAKTIESVSDVLYGLQQQQERLQNVALSLALRGIGGLGVLVPVVLWTGSALAGASSLAVAWATVLLAFDVPRARRIARERGGSLRPDWNVSTQRRLVRLAYPLGMASFLGSLNTNLPRYFVRHHLGAADLGVFAAFAYLTSAGSTVVSALGQSALARLSRSYAEGHVGAFVRVAGTLAAVVVGVSGAGWLVAAVAGDAVIAFVYGPAFEPYAFLLVSVIAWATVQFLASLLGYCMAAVRQFRGQASVSLLATTATLVTCAAAIPTLGLTGAVWAGLAGASVQLVGSAGLLGYALLRDARRGAPVAFGRLPGVVSTEP